jgi:hypothetical protein
MCGKGQYFNTCPEQEVWTRTCEEIERVSRMPDGRLHAFHLYLELKLDYVQKPNETVLNFTQIRFHEHVTKAIERLLESDLGDQFVGYERYCRALKARMKMLLCLRRSCMQSTCVHDALVPNLDILQRYANFETRGIVRLAIGHRLRAELMELIFEYTIVAEEYRSIQETWSKHTIQATQSEHA